MNQFVLDAGFSISYQMLFRNLESDCNCVARIEVLSAHPLPDVESGR
jgi:hypothetical protein